MTFKNTLILALTGIGLSTSLLVAATSSDNSVLLEQLKKDKSLQTKVKQEIISKNKKQQININTKTDDNTTDIETKESTKQDVNQTLKPKYTKDNYYEQFTPFFYQDQISLVENIEQNQVSSQLQKPERFGANFFKSTGQLPITSGVPDDYVLSQGDTIKIAIYGLDQYEGELEINKDGKIVIPNVGALSIRGLTYQNAKKIISNKLASTYPNSNTIISIGNLSPFSVGVVGEVKKPGLYTLNALSKVKDALSASGGINDVGSMREIQIKRHGKTVATFDLYDLIRGGKDNGDIFLSPGDIIYIPTAKNLISLSGNVKTSAIFELKKDETLKDLIGLAGGANSDTTKTAKISRSQNGQKMLIEAKLDDKFVLQDGDKIVIGKIADVLENQVILQGNVYRKEAIAITKDESVGTLFKKLFDFYGKDKILMPDSDINYFLVKRIDKETLETLILSGNLNAAINGNLSKDVPLQSSDKIFILNKSMTQDIKYISVDGEVIREGKFRFFNGMKLTDALMVAGTKKESDLQKIKVTSTKEDNTIDVKYYTTSEANEVKLNPYDNISITNFVTNNDLAQVKISGAIVKGGSFAYSNGLSINDLINMGGGLKQNANQEKFEIISYQIENATRKYKVNILDLKEAIKTNMKLNPFDEVQIRQISGWDDNRTVVLKGEVKFPGIYTILPGEKLSNVIKRAGGYTDTAFTKGAVFTRLDIKKIQQESFKRQVDELESTALFLSTKSSSAGENSNDKTQMLKTIESIRARAEKTEIIGRLSINLPQTMEALQNSSDDITLKPGDMLAIPEKEDSVAIMGEVMSTTAVTFKEDETIMDYIARAGGLKESADEDGIFVIKANGEAKRIRSHFLFGLANNTIEKGDTIIVPLKVNLFSNMQFAKDITSILYQIAVSAASLKTLGAL